MAVSLQVINLENVKSEVKVTVDDNRPITWEAKLIKGKEFKMNIGGKEKTVYSMNLVQQPLLYLFAARFTDVEDVSNEAEDIKALQEAFNESDYEQLINCVNFTKSISKMMQYGNLVVEHPKYKITDKGIEKTNN